MRMFTGGEALTRSTTRRHPQTSEAGLGKDCVITSTAFEYLSIKLMKGVTACRILAACVLVERAPKS